MTGAATDIERLLSHLVLRADRGFIRTQKVVYVQNVAHLFAVAENGDVAAKEKPSLVRGDFGLIRALSVNHQCHGGSDQAVLVSQPPR